MKFFRAFLVFFMSSALMACVSQPNSPEWTITQTRVTQEENKTVLSAKLRPKSSMARGYVQAKAFGKDGVLLATSECKSTPTHFRHAGKRRQVVSGGYSHIAFPLLQADAKFDLSVFSDKSCTLRTR